MPHLAIDERFVDACSPVIGSTFDTCGTVTKSTIDHLAVTDLETLFKPGGLFADLDAWFFHSIEMKACGTRLYFWYDWIMANADRSMYRTAFKDAVRPGVRAVKGPSLLHPFIMGRQVSIVNRGYWYMESSTPIAAYAATGTLVQAIGDITDGPLDTVAGGVAVIRVSARHDIPNDAAEFLPGKVIHLFTTTGGIAQQGNWRVIDSAANTAATYIDILVADENAGSATPFLDLSIAPVGRHGVIIPGINNVNDYEQWCHNRPTIDPRKMVPFWYQTYRDTRCVDAEYLEVYKRLLVSNRAFKEFGDLDLAERNRQDEMESQKAFVNAFFFQKPISANQTLTLWESLEDINTFTEVDLAPGLGGKLKAKRANWVGVVEQLRTCGRVKDLHGNPLNLQELFLEIYDIKRARASQGRKITEIDLWTNSLFREQFHRGMLQYYRNIYDAVDHTNLAINIELGKTHDQLGITWDSYRVLHPASVKINVISDEFFDDWYEEGANVGAAEGDSHNLLLILDIGKPGPNGGTIYYAQLAANRKTYGSAKIEELARLDKNFRCVMETTSVEQTLISETGMPIVECPLNSLWIEGIRMTAPDAGEESEDYEDLYSYSGVRQ